MSNRYEKIEISCPICNKSNIIEIPRVLISQKKFDTIKIQIPQGAICSDHQFIVFLDSKGIIRGYERIDFDTLKSTVESEANGELSLRNLIHSIGSYWIFSFMHAKIFNYPTFIITDENFKYNANILNSIGNRMLPERYRGGRTIHVYKETDYDKIELNIKDGLIIDMNRHISQIPWKDKLKFEESIIEKALKIINEEDLFYIIQNLILNFIKEAEYALEILENTDLISKKDLIKQISQKLMNPKINNYRLNLIIEFINRRFSPKLTAKISKLKKT